MVTRHRPARRHRYAPFGARCCGARQNVVWRVLLRGTVPIISVFTIARFVAAYGIRARGRGVGTLSATSKAYRKRSAGQPTPRRPFSFSVAEQPRPEAISEGSRPFPSGFSLYEAGSGHVPPDAGFHPSVPHTLHPGAAFLGCRGAAFALRLRLDGQDLELYQADQVKRLTYSRGTSLSIGLPEPRG